MSIEEDIEKQKKEETEKIEAEKKRIADLEAENKGLKDKEMNFSKIRESAEKAEKEKADLSKQLEEEKAARVNDHKVRVVDAIAGSDNELKKLIEYHYGRIVGDAKTPEEIETKVKEAYTLATKGKSNSVRGQQGAGSGGNKPANSGVDSGEVDPETKKWSEEFNKHGADIKDEDLKKVANKRKK